MRRCLVWVVFGGLGRQRTILGNSHGEELFAPEEAGDISLEDVFTACMDCRRKKRGTYNVLAFEVDW